MKFLIMPFCFILALVPSYAILGMEYDRALSKLYNPYYMALKKASEAEKGLEMAHVYSPHMVKEKFPWHGKGYPHYYPLLVKEKKHEFEAGKEMAMHHPFVPKEKYIAIKMGLDKFPH